MRLQCRQASCIGYAGGGQGSVPKRKCSLFLDSSATSISRSHWWKLLFGGETRTMAGFSPGWRKYGLTGLTRWLEVECWSLTVMIDQEKQEESKTKLNFKWTNVEEWWMKKALCVGMIHERTWTEFGEKTVSGKFSLCIDQSIKKDYKSCYIYKAKLWLGR